MVLTEEVLANTDVLIWWGHMGHDQVEDASLTVFMSVF